MCQKIYYIFFLVLLIFPIGNLSRNIPCQLARKTTTAGNHSSILLDLLHPSKKIKSSCSDKFHKCNASAKSKPVLPRKQFKKLIENDRLRNMDSKPRWLKKRFRRFVTSHPKSGAFNSLPHYYKKDLVSNPDGTIVTPLDLIATTCLLVLKTKAFCSAVLVNEFVLLTSGGCVAGINPLNRLKPEPLYQIMCGESFDLSSAITTRQVFSFNFYESYNSLNSNDVRQKDIATIHTLMRYVPDKYYLKKLNFPPWPQYSIEKRNKEMYKVHKYCTILGRTNETSYSNQMYMLYVRVLSRQECAKHNLLVKTDEFCMIHEIQRNGPCEMFNGGPVVCGENAILEGILTFNNPENCFRINRMFLATRVDNYMDLLFRELYIRDTTTTPPPSTVSTKLTSPDLLILGENPVLGRMELDLRYVIITAAVCCGIILCLAGVIAFYLIKKKLEKALDKKPQVDARYTLSVNLIVPIFLMISRVVLFCQLRKSMDKEMEKDKRRKHYKSPKL